MKATRLYVVQSKIISYDQQTQKPHRNTLALDDKSVVSSSLWRYWSVWLILSPTSSPCCWKHSGPRHIYRLSHVWEKVAKCFEKGNSSQASVGNKSPAISIDFLHTEGIWTNKVRELKLTVCGEMSSLMYSSPMKEGSDDLAACVGCWGCSTGPLVQVCVSLGPAEPIPTLGSVGCCSLTGVDVGVFEAGVGVVWCWSVAEESSGWKVEAVGGEPLGSSLLCLEKSFIKSCKLLGETETFVEPGRGNRLRVEWDWVTVTFDLGDRLISKWLEANIPYLVQF